MDEVRDRVRERWLRLSLLSEAEMSFLPMVFWPLERGSLGIEAFSSRLGLSGTK